MLLTAVTLDAFMTASDALARLARHGLWLDPAEPEAAKWIAERATLLGLEIPETERRLKRDIQAYGVAVRRQADANILWYALDAVTVVSRCAHKSTQPLIDVLRLHETDSVESVEPANADGRRASVVVQDGAPAAVCISPPTAAASPRGSAPPRSRGLQPTVSAGAPRPSEIHSSGLWPRVDAPEYARAGQRFDVVIGLGASKQEGLAGGPLGITLPAGADTFQLAIELASDGFDAPDGWSRTMTVPVDNPTAATVSISLVGREPIGVQPVHLTTIEVRYLIGTTVCGFAARPIVIGRTTDRPPDFFKGVAWLAQPSFGLFEASPTDIVEPDLTLELAKPDRNPARGCYVCSVRSPLPLGISGGPFDVDLGQDAKTFASTIIDGVRAYGANPLGMAFLRSLGALITEKLPPEFFEALSAVASHVAPDPPSVLIISSEPFVPWELASVDPPLDATRPPFLGAQAIVGRWLRDTAPARGAAKPAPNPPAHLDVDHMAVMVGKYKGSGILADLPAAESEAEDIVRAYQGIALPATPTALSQLLDAKLPLNFDTVGAGAVHFAGHGQFNPADPDSSVLFLSDGSPVSSMLFRAAQYGGDRQPFIFLNACMIGIGGELLGDMGGFPGNCLRGGFGAVLGALWAVDDAQASGIAREFWRRALPTDGSAPESVGAILRDFRQRYSPSAGGTCQSTYLAYTYYGHPRLLMRRKA